MSGFGASYSGGGRAGEGGDRPLPENFPVGMRVLLVDDDVTCLAVVKRMLDNCKYEVTTCNQATTALSLLRENRGSYDIIISDVHMPDMDGFRLLELVGLEMDLPVIMMSADTRFNIVMKGIKHGACDFLIKPVRMAELQNIWQHVVRRKWLDNKETEHSGSVVESDHVKQGNDDAEYGSATNDGTDGSLKSLKKKRDIKEEEDSELDNADPSLSKKPRVVWSVELHQQFVNAVNQLGIDKAVPKRILELMNVPGLTRENVASHLQKFRLYLKRLSGVAQHHTILPNSLCGTSSSTNVGHLGSIDVQTLAATGHIPAETLAALQNELLGRPSQNLPLPTIDQYVIQPDSLQDKKPPVFDKGISFVQPVLKGQSMSSLPVWSSNTFGALASSSNVGGMNTSQDSSMLPTMLQQQQAHPVLSDTHRLINVQPSCIVPLKPAESFQFQSGPAMANQDFPVIPLQRASNMKVQSTLAPVNQNSAVLASQPSTTLQRGNIPVLMNQNSEVVPSQSLPNISLTNDLRIRNQNSAMAPSQPFTSFQILRNPAMTSQNPMVSSSPSSSAFQSDNNLVPICHNRNLSTGSADYNPLSAQLNVGSSAVRQPLCGGFSNVIVTNSYSTIGSQTSRMILPTDGNNSGQDQSPSGNISHPNGLVCHTPATCNVQIANNEVLGKLHVQDQGSSLGFVGKSTFLPSRFAMDDMDFPDNAFTHSNVRIADDGYLLNQDDFTLNGSVKNGPCATTNYQMRP